MTLDIIIAEKPVSLLVNASLQTGSWEKVADTVPDIIGEPYVESEDMERKKIEPVRRKRRPGPKRKDSCTWRVSLEIWKS